MPDLREGPVDIVLGVSVTTTTVRMVLIEGEKADGVIIECATFDTAGGVVNASASEQISAAILATQQNAFSHGHHLVMSGVTWDDEPAPATLSDGIAARDLHNVVLVAEQKAAGALAQNVGRALGYDTTAVMVMRPETATLSVVGSDDGSIVEARMCTLDGGDVTDVLPDMVTTLESRNPNPGSVFLVGSRSAVCSVKSSLEKLIPQPVIVPEEPEFALARGAALAAANVPDAEASTCGLAYSQDPDELAAFDHAPVKLANADTQAALFDYIGIDDVAGSPPHGADHRVRIPIGSVAAATLVIGAVTLAMLVAANVQPAVDRDALSAGVAESSALVPGLPAAAAPAPAALAEQPHQQPPTPQRIPVATPAAQPPPAPPLPAPTVQKRAPVVQIRQPAPSRVIAQPAPVVAEKPPPATPVAVESEPAQTLPVPGEAPVSLAVPAAAAPPPLPIFTPPLPPASSLSPLLPAPSLSPAAQSPPFASSPWIPPWLRIGTPPSQQQASQPAPSRRWVPSLSGPQQDIAQWPQQPSSGLQIVLGPRLQAAPPQWTPSQVPQWTPAPVVPQRTPSLVPQLTPSLVPQLTPSLVPQLTPSLLPQWTPAPVVPRWIPAPPLQPSQIPGTSRSPYPILR